MPNHTCPMDWASMDPEGIYGGRIFAEMTEIPPSAKAPAPSAAAQRVRRHREGYFYLPNMPSGSPLASGKALIPSSKAASCSLRRRINLSTANFLG